jgi:hypothetical protein
MDVEYEVGTFSCPIILQFVLSNLMRRIHREGQSLHERQEDGLGAFSL